MTDWIKYDGTNKPDADALVRVRLNSLDESQQTDWKPAGYWFWDYGHSCDQISHFQLKDKENDNG